MNFKQIGKSHTKYMVTGLQAMILFIAVCAWLLGRGNAYSRVFSVDEYSLSDTAAVGEDVYTDATLMGEGGVFLSTPALSLKKGIYQVQVDYIVDSPESSLSVWSSLGPMELHCPPVNLDPSSYSTVMTLDLSRGADDVVIQASFSGTGQITITNMGIYETSYGYKKNIFYAILLCLFINLGYFFIQASVKIKRTALALSGIFLVACYPLYADFLTVGHDLPFHLLRIEAISQGLSNGVFPVKLHPLWAREHGYAVGIFYGDALLYFPALLRLLGFSIQSAYKFFVAFANLGTILLSYFAFRRIFSDENLGLLGTLAYTLAPYRLMDMYTRASVGEYTAMMFLPLVLYGFYMIFKREQKKNWWKHGILAAFGLSGLIQSHVLSTVMIGFVVLLTCLLMIRRILDRHVLRSLLTAAGLTVLLNLNFIVPFLDFYGEDIMINSPDWTGRTVGSFQAGGLFPIQLFTLFQHSNGGAWASTAGVNNEATYGIGILLTIGLLLLVYLLCIHPADCRNNRNFRPAILCLLLSCLLLYMCTCYFPWDAIASLGSVAENVIYSLQFPWRLLAPATVLLVFVLCYAFDVAGRVFSRQSSLLLAGSLVLLAVNCGWYFFDFSFSGDPYRVYHTSELYTMQMYSYDYLPEGTDPEAIRANAVYQEGVSMEEYRRRGTTISCDISAQQEGAYVDLPLMYYKYYRCTDMDTSQELPVSAGTNNMVRVTFPSGYSGPIQVGFTEPWFWRLAEVVSFLTFACVIFLLLPKPGTRVRRRFKIVGKE